MKQFEGKVAIVTGGTERLGASIVALLAERGAEGILVCGRDDAKGRRQAQDIGRNTGCRVVFVAADLADVEDCRVIVAMADDAFGRIDTLINVDASRDPGTLLDTSPEQFDRLFAVNARAPFFLAQATVKVMLREKTEGTIVNIDSMASLADQDSVSAYRASMGATATFTQQLASSLLGDRIRVNGLNIASMAPHREDEITRQYEGAVGAWQLGAGTAQRDEQQAEPNDVAQTVAFLASAESAPLTGWVVDFDPSMVGGFDPARQSTPGLRLAPKAPAKRP